MLFEVFKIALIHSTGLDILIMIVGGLSIAFIFFLGFEKRKFPKEGEPDSRRMKLCCRLNLLYQYGIEACPLLGTLGTVVSLIHNSVNPSELQSSFLFALTSTFWGIVMALICKFFESLWGINGYFEDEPEERG